MNLLWLGLAGITILAIGNGMLGASTRRSIAVQAGRKHSQTGELLVEMPRSYRVRGWVFVVVGLVMTLTAIGVNWVDIQVPLLNP